MKPRILITRRWPEAVEQRLAARYDVALNETDTPLTLDQLRAAMGEYDALCPTVSDKVPAEVLSAPAARVRIIANYGAGFEHIDLGAAKAAGLVVTNTPDVLTDATAELAVLLMLMASRRAGEGERELRAGQWTGWRPTHLLGQSLAGKTLGLVGYGRIARATAQRARAALGMELAYYSRRRATDEDGATYHDTLESLATTSDVLSLHTPGGPETHHLVNAALLARMKPTAILINTARGSVVNESDLAQALTDGVIAGAGLDVYQGEPKVDPVLLDAPNLVLLPHLGSATLETRTAMGMRVADNLDRFFDGEPRVTGSLELVERALDGWRGAGPFILGLCGAQGSGKSTLAEALTQRLTARPEGGDSVARRPLPVPRGAGAAGPDGPSAVRHARTARHPRHGFGRRSCWTACARERTWCCPASTRPPTTCPDRGLDAGAGPAGRADLRRLVRRRTPAGAGGPCRARSTRWRPSTTRTASGGATPTRRWRATTPPCSAGSTGWCCWPRRASRSCGAGASSKSTQLARPRRGRGRPGARVMSDAEIGVFIQHYERLTRHILSDMPGHADLTIRLDAQRRIEEFA
jgi:lactate dehydrogenase-like 2-hydroxyacid dehydrogenase